MGLNPGVTLTREQGVIDTFCEGLGFRVLGSRVLGQRVTGLIGLYRLIGFLEPTSASRGDRRVAITCKAWAANAPATRRARALKKCGRAQFCTSKCRPWGFEGLGFIGFRV